MTSPSDDRSQLQRDLDEAIAALRHLADVHHRTLTGSILHDPHNQDWTECECKTCQLAQSIVTKER